MIIRLFCNWHSTDNTEPTFSKNQIQRFMADINSNNFFTRILNGLRHVSLPSENFTAKIFSTSRSVFPGFRCKANSYYIFLKSAKWTMYIASSALNFSVSHKTSLTRTDDINVIVFPNDFKHMVDFLVKLFCRSVI